MRAGCLQPSVTTTSGCIDLFSKVERIFEFPKTRSVARSPNAANTSRRPRSVTLTVLPEPKHLPLQQELVNHHYYNLNPCFTCASQTVTRPYSPIISAPRCELLCKHSPNIHRSSLVTPTAAHRATSHFCAQITHFAHLKACQQCSVQHDEHRIATERSPTRT